MPGPGGRLPGPDVPARRHRARPPGTGAEAPCAAPCHHPALLGYEEVLTEKGRLQQLSQDIAASLEAALKPPQPIPGFAPRRVERVEVAAPPGWFIDRCRRIYMSIPGGGDRSRTIGITSALAGEGKTSVALGIATALASDTG